MPVAFWRWQPVSICDSESRTRRGPYRTVHHDQLPEHSSSPLGSHHSATRSTASSPGMVSGGDPSDQGRDSLAPEHRFANVLPRTRIAQAVRCQGAAQEQALHAPGDGQARRGPTAVSRSSAQLRRDGRACGLPMRCGSAPGRSSGHCHQPARAGEETPVVCRQKKVEQEEGKFCLMGEKETATKFGEYRRKKRRHPPVTVASLRLFLRSSTGPPKIRRQPPNLDAISKLSFIDILLLVDLP